MDVDKVYKLFAIAEQAPKFPHLQGRVLEWVQLQLKDVDREIVAEIEDFKAHVKKEVDERGRVMQAKAKAQAEQDKKATTKPAPKTVEEQTDAELGLDNMVEPEPNPEPLPRL